MQIHTGKLAYPCTHPECEKSFPTNSKLKHHLKTHSGKCFSFSNLMIATEELRYHCGHAGCDEGFSKWSELQKHVKESHSSLDCPVCGRIFKRKDVLKSHIKTHDDAHVPSVPCDYDGCGKVFMTVCLFRKFIVQAKSKMVHIKSFHLNVRPFACTVPLCGATFAHKHLLVRHRRTHDEVCLSSCNTAHNNRTDPPERARTRLRHRPFWKCFRETEPVLETSNVNSLTAVWHLDDSTILIVITKVRTWWIFQWMLPRRRLRMMTCPFLSHPFW